MHTHTMKCVKHTVTETLRNSLSVPHLDGMASPNLLLQLENAVEEGLGRGRAPRDVDVHWDYPVTAPHHCI